MMIVDSRNERAWFARRPGQRSRNDIVNDSAPILFSQHRRARPQVFFDTYGMHGHDGEDYSENQSRC